jgi:hypothetical protein
MLRERKLFAISRFLAHFVAAVDGADGPAFA